MWIFTDDGFLSVVSYDVARDTNVDGVHATYARKYNGDYLLVRARVIDDLYRLQDELIDMFGAHVILDTDETADYAYRALVDTDTFAQYMAKKVKDVDYTAHFKEVVRDRAPEAPGRYNAMLRIWSNLAAIQDVPPYGRKSAASSLLNFDFEHDWM